MIDVDIGNTPGTTSALATSGAINLASGTNAIPNSYTTAVNIGAGSTTGAITIGNVSNTATINSATINVNGALTMGSTRNITLKTNGTAPTQDTQLGGIRAGTVSTATTFAEGATFASLTLTQAGVYIMTFNLSISVTTKGTGNNKTQLIGTSASSVPYGASNPSATTMNWTGCQVFLATASEYKVILFQTNTTFAAAPALDGYFTATRIA